MSDDGPLSFTAIGGLLPLGTLLVIAGQLAFGIWWAADLSSRLRHLENEDAQQREVREMTVRAITGEVRQLAGLATELRITQANGVNVIHGLEARVLRLEQVINHLQGRLSPDERNPDER